MKRNKRSDYTTQEIIEAYLKGGSYTGGAFLLGVPRKTFTYWMDQITEEAIKDLNTWGFSKLSLDPHATPQRWPGIDGEFDPDTPIRIEVDTELKRGSQAVDNALGGFEFNMPHKAYTVTGGLSEDINVATSGGCTKVEPYSNLHEDDYWTTEDAEKQEFNSRILVISDMHIPYHHPDALAFLRAIKEKYEPTRIISVGDEVDYHALSFHDSDPDLMSPGDELKKAQEVIHELYTLFPEMDIMHSNHGSLLYRRGKHHGIPRHMLKGYAAVLGLPNEEDWRWHEDLTIQMPSGAYVHFHHGKGSSALKVAQQLGMSYVAGHYHSQFNIQYYGNPLNLHWAMQVGCLIDDHSMAFAYNRLQSQRPIIGTAMIIEGQPKLIPLVKTREGRWNGELH